MELNSALLTLVGTLVAAMIWMVKSLMTRLDKLMVKRDVEIGKALASLAKAVDNASRVEEREEAIHAKIIDGITEGFRDLLERLTVCSVVQDQMLQLLQTINAKGSKT